MSPAITGTLVAAVLAVTLVAVGFWQALVVGLAMLIGALAGRYVSGDLDINAVLNALRGRKGS